MVNWEADRTLTIEQLENDDWGEPPYDSHLVTTCHRLRRKPIGTFTPEDLRIMIGQAIGVDFLLPIALELLVRYPLVSGDYYPGDLLANVLELPESVWTENPDAREYVETILDLAPELPEELREPLQLFRARTT